MTALSLKVSFSSKLEFWGGKEFLTQNTHIHTTATPRGGAPRTEPVLPESLHLCLRHGAGRAQGEPGRGLGQGLASGTLRCGVEV